MEELASSPQSVYYLQQRDKACIRIPGVDDAAEYQEVLQAYSVLGFDEADRVMLSKIIAGILHMGNIAIETNPEAADDSCIISPRSTTHLHAVCELWSLPEDVLTRSLLFRSVKSGGRRASFALSPYVKEVAEENKNALVKELYNKCFDFIVEKINQKMDVATETPIGTIGVLDIFGFEIFTKV